MKKDGDGDGRRADVSCCGSNFIYARTVLMESEALKPNIVASHTCRHRSYERISLSIFSRPSL
jgi:hypothetical protein